MTRCQHSWIVTLSVADGKDAVAVVPSHRNAGEDSFLVTIGIAVVFVEREGRVGAGIDTHFERIFCFGSRLCHWTQRQDRARTNVERNDIQWNRSEVQGLCSGYGVARVAVEPVAFGQINLPRAPRG